MGFSILFSNKIKPSQAEGFNKSGRKKRIFIFVKF